MKLSRLPLLLALALAYACANLPAVNADTCGNRVIDAREDCDTFDLGGAKCGAPGTPNACRLLCTGASECPAGWGCGTDGLCRAPSGRFDTTFVPVPSGQTRLQLGDFDGDGRQDLLASSAADLGRPEIHYVDDSGHIAQTLLVGAQVRTPQVTRVLGDGDALDDIVFASSSGGVDVLLGQGDRTVVPVAYPTYLQKTDVSFLGLSGSLAEGNLPLTGAATHGLGVVVGMSNGTPLLAGTDLLNNTPLNVPSGVSIGSRTDLVDALVDKVLPGSICGELVLLVATPSGKSELDIIPICKQDILKQIVFNDATGTPLPATRVDLGPIGALKLTPATLATGDLNGDGQKDVIIDLGPQTGAVQHAPWIYSPKTGTLSELVYTLRGGAVGVRGAPILATGDLNADGLTDVVFSDMLAFGAGKPGGVAQFVPYLRNNGDAWTQAIIADMNGDALPDVAAISPSRTFVDFYVGAKGGLVSPGTLATTGVAARLGTGDYDGDGVLDLGILSRPAADSAGGDVLIAYGRRQGLPDAPQRVASFALANDLTTLPSFVDILTVIGNSSTGPTTSAAGMVGDADRFPLAVKPVPESLGQGLAVFAGALSAKGQTDVGILHGDLTTARLTGAGAALATQGASFQGDLGAFASLIPLSKDAGKSLLFGADTADAKANRYLANAAVQIAVGDINGDQLDEVFVVSATVGGKVGTITQVMTTGAGGRVDLAPAPAPLGVAGKLLLVDADGDGWKDLVYISGFMAATPTRVAGQPRTTGASVMTVFWNDGKGKLATTGTEVTALTVVQTADAGSACAKFSDPTALASIHADPAGKPGVAILTAQCLYVGTLDRSGGGRATSVLDHELGVGFSLAVGDMSGDGVDDLAYLDDRSLTILKQAPVLP